MALVLAASGTIGAKALFLYMAWLIGGATSTYMSERKGYGPKVGLATGLLLSLIGTVIWLLIPARPGSDWKIKGWRGDDLKYPHNPPPQAPAASDT